MWVFLMKYVNIVIDFNFTIMLLAEMYFLFSVLDKLICPIRAVGLRNYWVIVPQKARKYKQI